MEYLSKVSQKNNEYLDAYMKQRNETLNEATMQLLELTGINMRRVKREHVKYIKRYLKRKKYELHYKENDTQIYLKLKHKGEIKVVRIIIKPKLYEGGTK